jgi:hypothetical protein
MRVSDQLNSAGVDIFDRQFGHKPTWHPLPTYRATYCKSPVRVCRTTANNDCRCVLTTKQKKYVVPTNSMRVRGNPKRSTSNLTAVLTCHTMAWTIDSNPPSTKCKRKVIMPASKTYTKAQWDEFARRLDALPEKPPSEKRVSVRDAMPKVRAHINAAREKGYSLEQLIDQAKEVGMDLKASAFRYALHDATKRGAKTRSIAGSQQSPNKANPLVTRSDPRRFGQQSGTSSRAKAKTEPDNNKPGSMIVHDAFSFEIRPDTENL